jgi:hypothetical protein
VGGARAKLMLMKNAFKVLGGRYEGRISHRSRILKYN